MTEPLHPAAGSWLERLERIEGAVNRMLDALLGSLDGKPGIISRVEGLDRRVAELERGTSKANDRAWALGLGAIGTAVTQIILYFANHTGGKHP